VAGLGEGGLLTVVGGLEFGGWDVAAWMSAPPPPMIITATPAPADNPVRSPKIRMRSGREGRRYLGLEVLKRARVTTVPEPVAAAEEVPTSDIPGLSANQLQKITRFAAKPPHSGT
jgi:hypothetical protein